jgi:hypothetical protein
MIIVNWSAVTGYESHTITAPHRKPLIKRLKKDMVYNVPTRSLSPKKTHKNRDSKGNHKWKAAIHNKYVKRKGE